MKPNHGENKRVSTDILRNQKKERKKSKSCVQGRLNEKNSHSWPQEIGTCGVGLSDLRQHSNCISFCRARRRSMGGRCIWDACLHAGRLESPPYKAVSSCSLHPRTAQSQFTQLLHAAVTLTRRLGKLLPFVFFEKPGFYFN